MFVNNTRYPLLIFNQSLRGGFSLLELTIVLIIITILTSAAIPQLVNGYTVKAANKTALDISAIQEACRAYYVANNAWPDGSVYGTPIAALQSGVNPYLPPSWNAINPFGFSSAIPSDYSYNVTSNQNLLTVSTVIPTAAIPIIQSLLPDTTVSAAPTASEEIIKSSVTPSGAVNGFGQWQADFSAGQVYQALTDGIVYASAYIVGNEKSGFSIITGPNNPPSNNPSFTMDGASNSSTTEFNESYSLHVRKGDYWQVLPFGASGNSNPVVYSIAWLPVN